MKVEMESESEVSGVNAGVPVGALVARLVASLLSGESQPPSTLTSAARVDPAGGVTAPVEKLDANPFWEVNPYAV